MEPSAVILAFALSVWSVLVLLAGICVGWRIKSGLTPLPQVSMPRLNTTNKTEAEARAAEARAKLRPQEPV